jgi:hypothetical protein
MSNVTTKLEGPLKREITLGARPYTLTIDPDGLHLVPKGKRKGVELAWKDLVNGDAAMASALNASLAGISGRGTVRAATSRK